MVSISLPLLPVVIHLSAGCTALSKEYVMEAIAPSMLGGLPTEQVDHDGYVGHPHQGDHHRNLDAEHV